MAFVAEQRTAVQLAVAAYVQGDLEAMQKIMAFVRQHVGGRNVLWPLLQSSGLRYSLRQLSIAIKSVDDEPVDYEALDGLSSEDEHILGR